MTSPLTPADCDLRNFPFLHLDVVRLRDSDLVALESAEAFRAAVLLWCASWHQLPAASLPDDDRILANLAGYGRVVKEWLKVRGGALRGWVKCDDGRLYHPVLAKKANEAWTGKLMQQWKTECARIKKHNQRHADDQINFPTFEEWLSMGTDSNCPQGHIPSVPVQSIGKHDPRERERDRESDISIPPPPNVRVNDEKFQMHSAWKPSENFPSLARQAGVVVPGDSDFTEMLMEFRTYWLTQAKSNTQLEWDYALVKNIKAAKLKADGRPKSRRDSSRHSGFEKTDYREGVNADGSF